MHFERARSFPTGEINPLIPRKCPTVTFPAKTTLFAGRQTKPSALIPRKCLGISANKLSESNR
jgi:hypothetical protein